MLKGTFYIFGTKMTGYGLRILVPITATDEELSLGLDRLEESLVAAS